jgi:hypothetical protein
MNNDDAAPQPPPDAISADDLARLMMASGMPEHPPSKGALRRKLLIAALVGGLGVGASVMSCVGQSFSYRQARALEGIEQQIKALRAGCAAPGSP